MFLKIQDLAHWNKQKINFPHPCRVMQGECEWDMKYYIVKETKDEKEYKKY